jgi:hypothetical protein
MIVSMVTPEGIDPLILQQSATASIAELEAELAALKARLRPSGRASSACGVSSCG